jgi:predicted amidohydrolase YtcJ
MRNLIFILALMLTACQAQKDTADLLVLNANVYTVDDNFSKTTAFAVRNGIFVAVGSSEELKLNYNATQIVDAAESTIVPGLIDAHCHFYSLGLNQLQSNLTGTTSFEEVLERVQEFHKLRPSNFILGRGWDQNDWPEKEFPTKKELDVLFPDTPVALERIDGHALLVNQKALNMAGIDKKTSATGGEIVKHNGELTGILIDGPMNAIYRIMPTLDNQTRIEALKEAEKICIKNGLTTVNDAGLDRTTIELIDSLQQAGDLSIRVYAMVSNYPENLDYYLDKGIIKTEKLNVRSVKVYGDGALGSRGAALKAPYSDKPGHYGAMITPVENMEALAKRIANSDYQMNTHAIGDSANVVVLRAYAKTLEGMKDRRWKVEHAQIISSTDFDFFKNGVIPSIQPTHATSDMYWADERLGEERIKGAYAYKELLNQAGIVALGTDFPVEEVSPFLTFYAAVARKDLNDYPAEGFQMKDALTREETLRGMTIWAAYSNFEENEKGSIEVGKRADFVVLSQDIMEVPLKDIPGIMAEQVYIDGILQTGNLTD